jgi:Domain of unknown function (DUF397)
VINELLSRKRAARNSSISVSIDESGWRRSTYCSNTTCVEVNVDGSAGHVAVRDGKSPALPLIFDFDEWRAFVSGVKSGEFDPPAG